MVTSLLVVLLLLSLVGGVLAVVVKARRKMKAKKTAESQSNEEDRPPKIEDIADNAYTCQNARHQPSESSRHNEDAHDYATAENIFINPASATASFSDNVYDSANYSEVDQRLFAAGGKVTVKGLKLSRNGVVVGVMKIQWKVQFQSRIYLL